MNNIDLSMDDDERIMWSKTELLYVIKDIYMVSILFLVR